MKKSVYCYCIKRFTNRVYYCIQNINLYYIFININKLYGVNDIIIIFVFVLYCIINSNILIAIIVLKIRIL